MQLQYWIRVREAFGELMSSKEAELVHYKRLQAALDNTKFIIVNIVDGIWGTYPVYLPLSDKALGTVLESYVSAIHGTSGKIAIRGLDYEPSPVPIPDSEGYYMSAPAGPASGCTPKIVDGGTYKCVEQNIIYASNPCCRMPGMYCPMDCLLKMVAGDVPEGVLYSHKSAAEEKLLYHTDEGFGLGCLAAYHVRYDEETHRPDILYLFTRRELPVSAPKEVDGVPVVVVELPFNHPLRRGLVPPQVFRLDDFGFEPASEPMETIKTHVSVEGMYQLEREFEVCDKLWKEHGLK